MFIINIDNEVSLKLVEEKDAKRVFELTEQSRDYLRQWLPWVDSTRCVKDTKNFISSCVKKYQENRSITMFILYKGEIVGAVSYNKIDWSNKIAYIGYWLGKDYQGLGIMTKATKALTYYAFNELKLNRVDIRAAEENIKSRGIPERLGFINEGRIRKAQWLYDRYVDHIVYGMLAEEWNQEV